MSRIPLTQNLLHLIGYGVYRGCTLLARWLPLTFLFLLGQVLGWGAAFLLRRRRSLAVMNIKLALGVDEAAAKILARRHFLALGANLLSMLKIPSMSDAQIWRHVTFEVAPGADADGKGWVAVLAHMSNWELLTRFSRLFPQYRFGAIYQKLANRRVDRHFNLSRAALGITLFDRKEGFWDVVAFLETGGVVGVLADQYAGDSGTWMPFFGRLTSTTTLPAALAHRVGVKLVPISVTTVGLARWRVAVGLPLPVAGTPEIATAAVNRELERQITAAPADWLWTHDRWKTPRFGFLLSAGSRRIFLPPSFDRSKLMPYRILVRSVADPDEAKVTAAVVQAIKRGRPDAHVTILAPDALAGFWRNIAGIDAVISFSNADSILRVARKISAEGPFAVGILLPPDPRAAREMFLAKVPYRFPFRSGQNLSRMPEPESVGEERYRRILSAAGAEW